MGTSLITVTPVSQPSKDPQLGRLEAMGTVQANVDWPLPPEESESGIGSEVIAVLCRALLRSGNVAFRWYDQSHERGGTFFERPRPSLVEALTVAFRSEETTATFGVVVTGDEAIARDLFEWNGWAGGGQAVLVHDPDADLEPIIHALQRGMDWRHRSLPPGVRLLFGSGHDGCFALVAATTAEHLARFVTDVQQGGSA